MIKYEMAARLLRPTNLALANAIKKVNKVSRKSPWNSIEFIKTVRYYISMWIYNSRALYQMELYAVN